MSPHLLRPDFDCNNEVTSIRLDIFKEKGIKAVLIDVDGTLVSNNQEKLDDSVISWINKLKYHYQVHLISNNPSFKRINNIAKQLNLPFTYKAFKPRRKSLVKAIDNLNLEKQDVAIIGDRIFTDVLAGNRLGIYTILVNTISNNNFKFTQTIERILAKLLGAF